MDITVEQIVTWLIVGALAGYVVGRVITGKKEGYGWFTNLAVGLAGALLGGVVFALFKIDIGAGIAISLNDVISAILGALVLLLILWMMKKYKKKPAA